MAGPSTRPLLLAQTRQEVAALHQLAAVLAEVVPEGETGLLVVDRFGLLLDRVERELDAVLAEADPETGWPELETARAAALDLKREVLAYCQGELLRRAGLDHGIGDVSQRLLDHLARSTGIDRRVLRSVAESEFLTHTVSMIRNRFPDVSVWNLPVLAHELGHHVAANLSQSDPRLREESRPVREYLSEEADNSGQGRKVGLAHLHELFADVYATYVLGAAYPLQLLVLAARPGPGTQTHPAWSRRARTVLSAVEALGRDRHPSAAGFRALSRKLASFARANFPDTFGTAAEQALAGLQARAMTGLLAEHAYARARYPMPDRVHSLVIDPREPEQEPVAGTTVADVLNAAWLWRLDRGDGPAWLLDEASRRAISLSRQVKE
ncbi:hypothetical protein [Amycolatopsis sp. CA-230715]|uniref:hypothetical protein n=1 Tax=Amycolatopsis sp. CA-230715 TaxID=2745196 RepID=UPI001C021A2F|nr:hypothetical protein [Amycolatopsis sp. CA-230715]QWF84070.1 hypothetical protein HUW46_07514 [Amycolatopsis sp. CA-230715]